jgi:cation-transporting ATPase E
VWWKLVLLAGSVAAYLVLFAWPFAREFFALDISNVGAVTTGLVCGAVGVVLVEVSWTVSGLLHGEHRRMFARSEDQPCGPAQ